MAQNCARGRAGHCGGGVVVADAAPSGQARIARVGHPAAACFPALALPEGNVTTGAQNEIPLDRFAGRSQGRRTAAKVPGYLSREAKEKRQQYSQTYQGLEPQIKELDAEMKHTATFDHGRGDGRSADGDDTAPQELRSKRQALDAQIATAKADWRSVQDKVDAANKQIVNGRAYKWNKDNYLGGSDHFVPVGQAHKQLAGAGYGHRYSIEIGFLAIVAELASCHTPSRLLDGVTVWGQFASYGVIWNKRSVA
eukprot:CAMPEP_0179405014 /NCGR_PEP_ID=MMETSP0799-20121207/32_1 /TAXON_ID=46947 /ORGANISM="Geminigera cryophila, Strain CCMP2564" /LENGTH=252 /DNA_ID=CAMNT_0021175777 /DNA_START=19 /DNA_END=776 /DNA_ORIENTATION=+